MNRRPRQHRGDAGRQRQRGTERPDPPFDTIVRHQTHETLGLPRQKAPARAALRRCDREIDDLLALQPVHQRRNFIL